MRIRRLRSAVIGPLFLLFLTVSGFPGQVDAQGVLVLDASGKTLQGEPGQTLTGTVHVDNPNADPVTVRTSISDWYYDDQGQVAYAPAGSIDRSAAPWTTVNPSTFGLDGKSGTDVRYSVSIPNDVAEGTHWLVVFFQAENPNPPAGKTLAQFSFEVGYILYVNVGSAVRSGRITSIVGALSPKRSLYRVSVLYENTGNTASLLSGSVDLQNAQGDTVVKAPLDHILSLPDAVRRISVTFAGPLPAGPYSALVVLSGGSPGQDIAGQYGFSLAQELPAPAGSGAASPSASSGTAGSP